MDYRQERLCGAKMTNATLTEAIKEAYASAPAVGVLLDTLEIRHSAFIDDDGNATAIRVVADHKNLEAFLEQDAPLNGGEEVTFIAYSFTIDLPHVDDKASPRAVITIDNVSREIIENIERAVESQEVIKVTYRPYLTNDLSTPQHNPPLHLVLSEIEANVHKITAKASFGDLANKAFPNDTYTPSRFPGLGR